MNIKRVRIDELSNDPANSRKHGARNLAAIVASLQAFGQQKPIVINSSGIVIAGNGTLEAARQLKWTHINCVETGLDSTQATAFAIADNRTAELAEWDEDALSQSLAALQNDQDIDHLSAGFTDDEIEALIGKDLSDEPKEKTEPEYKEMFTITVECKSEEQQEQCFEMLQREGYQCRVTTL